MLLSTIIPNEINDYLQVQICLPQTPLPATALATASTTATATPTAKTTRAKRKRTKTKIAAIENGPHPNPHPAMDPNDGMAALAQIDTGCQVGDVINRRVLQGLRGEPQLRTTDSPIWMCSGLNNQCIESTAVLDIVVSFNKNDLKYTFSLPVRIAEDSKVDLILGLETIKKLNLVKIIPEFFQSPEISKMKNYNHSTN